MSESPSIFNTPSHLDLDGTKLAYHPDRLTTWKTDPLNTFPLYIEISPVAYCNHRCKFCALDFYHSAITRLDTSPLKAFIDDCASNGVKAFLLAGEGEPLLHPGILDIVDYTRNLGIDCAVTTNGIPLDANKVKLVSKLTWLRFSINAGTQGAYARIHQTANTDWERVWDNVRLAMANKGDCTISIQCVVLPENVETLEPLTKLAREAGVDYLSFKPFSQHKASKNQAYKDTSYSLELKSLMGRLVYEYSTDKFQVIPRLEAIDYWNNQTRNYPRCYATPYFWAYLAASGDVFTCSAFLGDDRFRLGNINETSFADLWTSTRRQAMISHMAEYHDISTCRINCRMNKANEFLDRLVNPLAHDNFI